MIRPWHAWVGYGVALAVVLAVMGYLTAQSLEMERREYRSRVAAAFEEDVRLALWRMDAAMRRVIESYRTARPPGLMQAGKGGGSPGVALNTRPGPARVGKSNGAAEQQVQQLLNEAEFQQRLANSVQ